MAAVSSHTLATEIAESAGVKPSVAKKVVAAFFDRIGDHLAVGNDVSVRGFGSFRGRYSPARKKTTKIMFGAEHEVAAKPASVKIKFFAGAAIKERASESVQIRARAAR